MKEYIYLLAICVPMLAMSSCSDDDVVTSDAPQEEGSEEEAETRFDLQDLYALDYDSLTDHGIYLPCTCDADSAAASVRDEDWHPEMPLTSFEDIKERQQEWIRQVYYKRGQKIHGVKNYRVNYRYDEDDYLKWGQLNGRNWMEYIDDEQCIVNLSIPGSHDSYTFTLNGGLWDEWGMTQEKSFHWQFNYGVRMFDVRVDASDGEIAHGALGTGIYFHEALGDMICQVNNYPSEGIIMVISKEKGKDSDFIKLLQSQFNKCFNNCTTYGRMYSGWLLPSEFSDSFVAYRPDLKMKDIRGKVCVLFRDECVKGKTDILDNYKGTFIYFGDLGDEEQTGQCSTGEYKYLCQDYCSDIKIDLKLNEIRTALSVKLMNIGYSERYDKFITSDRHDKPLLINHLSGYRGSGATMCYTEAAEYINAEDGAGSIVKNALGVLGIMPMDFVGSEWVDPGPLTFERKTWGRRMCSYIWQHNFYQDYPSLYWCMSNDQAQWDANVMEYVYHNPYYD